MKNYTKQFSGIALAIALGLSAGAASATAYSNLDTSSLDASGVAFSQTYNTGDTFNDIFTFTVPANNTVNATLSFITTNVSISSFSLLDPSNAVVPTTLDLSGGIGAPSLTTGNLSIGGTYKVDVIGTALVKDANYTVGVTVSPVPEPSEYALMASGLGLFGFIATRRNKKAA